MLEFTTKLCFYMYAEIDYSFVLLNHEMQYSVFWVRPPYLPKLPSLA